MIDDDDYLKAANPKDYCCRVAANYGIPLEAFEVFANEYDFYPKGKYAPDEDDVAPVTVQKVARDFGYPLDYLLFLQQEGVINYQLTYGDVSFLRRNRKAVKVTEGEVKLKYARPKKIDHPLLRLSYQQWIYRYYINRPGKRVYVDTVAKEVSARFGMPNDRNLKAMIRKIAEIVYNDRRKAKVKDFTLDEVEAQRRIEREKYRNHYGV